MRVDVSYQPLNDVEKGAEDLGNQQFINKGLVPWGT